MRGDSCVILLFAFEGTKTTSASHVNVMKFVPVVHGVVADIVVVFIVGHLVLV